MEYKPQALDVDKVSKMIDMYERTQRERELIERTKTTSFNEGYMKALDDLRCALNGSKYELKIPDSKELIRTVFYELCKELDMTGSDIYDAGLSIDETAARLAERIKDTLNK